jgi:pantetheine-phosphate adenylyltransferase
VGAHFIIKGVRSVKDFEYEREQAELNRRLGGVETLLLLADPTLACVSSSAVRELAHFGQDIQPFLPKP